MIMKEIDSPLPPSTAELQASRHIPVNSEKQTSFHQQTGYRIYLASPLKNHHLKLSRLQKLVFS